MLSAHQAAIASFPENPDRMLARELLEGGLRLSGEYTIAGPVGIDWLAAFRSKGGTATTTRPSR
ncbi:hypothetical protein DSM14862_03623 (plasmid) [Sulfitobacter indolifex]|nr:hypothetical protein DSM14862_03484 [Sulfitobacter indolifex]UOA20785.1 hypothetical protein DSM14862_03623 [Sulfitobacter indolifex]